MSRKKPIKAQRRQPQKNRRGIFIIGGVVLLALVAVVALVFQNVRPVSAEDYVTVEKKTWPQANGAALGPADAPVVIREFSDFQCPYCRQFDETVQPQIIEQYLNTGKVRFEYHHYLIIDANTGGSESHHAALASECAADQNAFWDYHEMLFANQRGEATGAFSDKRLKAFAEALGLDMNQFNSCFSSQKYNDKIQADEAQARSLNLPGTPALLVNDKLVENPLNFTLVKAAIDAALNGTSQ